MGWGALAALGVFIAGAAWRRQGVANWGLLAAALVLAVGVSPVALGEGAGWRAFQEALGNASGGGEGGDLLRLLVGWFPALLGLVFAMARRAFASSAVGER